MLKNKNHLPSPFNSHIEVGLRLLTLLTAAYPKRYSIQQLAVYDYMVVHSDDLPDGPVGLHPKTPQRNGEYLIRRSDYGTTLKLFMSRNLIEECYENDGLLYSATEYSAAFLDTLKASYNTRLKECANWVVDRYGEFSEQALNELMLLNLNNWGGESNLHSEILQEW